MMKTKTLAWLLALLMCLTLCVCHAAELDTEEVSITIFDADGEVAEEGTPSEIFDSPKTEKLRAFLKKND